MLVYFYCFVHGVKLRIYGQNTSKMRHFTTKCKEKISEEGTPSLHPRRVRRLDTRAFVAQLAPSALHMHSRSTFPANAIPGSAYVFS